MRPNNVVQLRMRHKPKRPTHAEVMERLQRARAELTRTMDLYKYGHTGNPDWETHITLAAVRYHLTRIEQYLTGEG